MRLGLRALSGAWLCCFCAVAPAFGAEDVYKTVFDSVNKTNLETFLKDMTGVNPVTVGGETFSIKDRYLPSSKAKFRKYWTAYFKSLGLEVTEQAFTSSYYLEDQGHNLEAVLPGATPDSVVIIVHYDSMGPHGADNPAVDDDMTGMSIALETARILKEYQGRRHYTVRFVAADYEEWEGLEGARAYAEKLRQEASAKGFKIVAAIDNEQSGWKEGPNTFDVFDCGGDTDSPELGDLLINTAKKYSTLKTYHDCMGANSDHYAMWEIGVPAVVYSEHDPFNNPHFDKAGGDIYSLIDRDYFFRVAQVGVTFATRVVGLE